ncbi:hypothetical protein [Petrocella sp. FN5]|uniref:hypothetical protein n=1 Tax=Petrocella sp. FN5 TaxID=3032002 RepID=UPI0023DB995D|nr:hypothetical protein [Petrocella sp. FN5]MDF1617708.1 hypothetical protein [Petrocella sp. FN5]
MKKKVLIHVYTIQVKNDILSILVNNGHDFLEVFNKSELNFKYNLIKDQIDLYIQELDENNYEESLDQIRRIDMEKVRTIVLIHKYSKHVIDDALALKVKDIIVLPMERTHLSKKILSFFDTQKSSPLMPSNQDKVQIQNYMEIDIDKIRDEINRAMRGKYPLSFVLVQYHSLDQPQWVLFKSTLNQLLRTTDIVMYFEANNILLICPFTPKNFLVEVENKVRKAYDQIKKEVSSRSALFLYGVTFPEDGNVWEALYNEMKDGIHDSKVISKFEGTLKQINPNTIRTQLKKDYEQ